MNNQTDYQPTPEDLELAEMLKAMAQENPALTKYLADSLEAIADLNDPDIVRSELKSFTRHLDNI